MGQTCAPCTRREEENSRNQKENISHLERHKGFFEYLEKHKAVKHNQVSTTQLQKATKMNMIMNSASNYWLNDNSSLFEGNHRTAVTYHVENISQLIRVHNSIITENEFQAAKKIIDVYHEYKKRKQANEQPKGDAEGMEKSELNSMSEQTNHDDSH
mmetsp:Transcript_28212/g.32648  ORF Transcript_28212/g.32648 Transcript_28212/m.32648 type:complete len:157 (+) Transcript_28212:33-503(+)